MRPFLSSVRSVHRCGCEQALQQREAATLAQNKHEASERQQAAVNAAGEQAAQEMATMREQLRRQHAEENGKLEAAHAARGAWHGHITGAPLFFFVTAVRPPTKRGTVHA